MEQVKQAMPEQAERIKETMAGVQSKTTSKMVEENKKRSRKPKQTTLDEQIDEILFCKFF